MTPRIPTVPARVNGELLSRPRQQQPEHYDQDVDWLLNDAPGLLGEVGVSYSEPNGGARIVVDTGPYHARMQSAMWAVAKFRRLNKVWRQLEPATRAVLVARYAQRRWPDGFVAHFGELVGVVTHLHTKTSQRLTQAARQPSKENAATILADALRAAQQASREAHRAWRQQRRVAADKELEHG